MSRLPDALLDDCRWDSSRGFERDPARHWDLDEADGLERLERLKPWLNDQQTRLWANRQDALLLVLQGPDGAGKDAVIRRVLNAFAPQGLRLSNFKAPDVHERRQDFLWRYRQQLPEAGLLGVFNRSYYEALVSDPQAGLCPPDEVPARLVQICGFERSLAQPPTHLLKCYLHISPAEQQQRLQQRLALPHKRWKLQASDLLEAPSQAHSQAQWTQVMTASDSPHAPWYLIPADHRWLRDLLVASLLARVFERLELQWPQAHLPADLDALRDA
ncbi:MAG: hypothetical protein ABWY06_02235 [Pseudomonas sp.]|uniref:hypothetical protein n=1 Tax=Pseudomonas sp. TaxID=306 RepID=UPI00339580AA